MIENLKEFGKSSLQRLFTARARDLDLDAETGMSLVIAPHADDESLGCGATIARLRSRNQPVRIIIVTDGAASGHSAVISAEKLAATRREEAENAAMALGLARTDVTFLQFPDGHTHEHDAALRAALAEQIKNASPARIFSPYGDDGHSDHRVIAGVIDRLFREKAINCPVYEYPIWFWSMRALLHLLQPQKLTHLRRVSTAGSLPAKKAAIAAHRSQYEAPTDETGWFTFPKGFLARFLTPFELYFEKLLQKH